MSLIWSEDLPTKGKRFRPNPTPRVPKTGWKPCTNFPSLAGAQAIAFDMETYDPELDDHGPGWGRGRGHILGISLATDDGFNKYFPMRHKVGFNHDPRQVLRYVSDQLSRPHQVKVGHNVLYDMGWAEHEGIKIEGPCYDTWTAEKLLDHSSDATLEGTSQRHLGMSKSSDQLYDWAWQAWGRGTAKTADAKRKCAMRNLQKIPAELVGFYAESDTALPLQILPIQFAEMDRLGLLDVFHMECDLLPVLVKMRMLGVSVDLDAAERARDQFLNTASKLQKQVDKIAGFSINTGSAQEIAKVFDRLKLYYPRTEKTGAPSFKGEFLNTVEHPIGALIVELQELKKYVSTFIDSAILGSQVNGKIHCQFKPMTAVTGRMSCADPNLQQVPSRNELAKAVRSIFIPDREHAAIGKWDYSSVESRILAHYAVGPGAKALRKEYRDNPLTDYHKWTIAKVKEITGITLERKPAKVISFGLGYGASPKKLASMLGLSLDDALPMFEAYHGGLKFVQSTMDHLSRYAEEHGHTRTILGRRATFDRWEPAYKARGAERATALPFNAAVRAYGPDIKRAFLHKAVNYTIQGSAADLMKMSIVKCHKDGIFDATGYPRLVVHDELVYSMQKGYNRSDFIAMKDVMENAVKFRVPIRTEGEIGPNWSKTEKF